MACRADVIGGCEATRAAVPMVKLPDVTRSAVRPGVEEQRSKIWERLSSEKRLMVDLGRPSEP